MSTTQPLDTAAIEARLAAATPGPWVKHDDTAISHRVQPRVKSLSQPGWYLPICNGIEYDRPGGNRYNQDNNLDLIAHAPADLRALLDEVRELRELLTHMLGIYDRLDSKRLIVGGVTFDELGHIVDARARLEGRTQ